MNADGKKIDIFNVGELSSGMYGLGTPSVNESFSLITSAITTLFGA